jgi:hypothetical protein
MLSSVIAIPCNRVPSNELTRTVHRTVEVRLSRDFFASTLSFLLVDGPGAEIGVDGHLAAWHPIQSESSSYFTDTRSTLGDDDEVDQEDNNEQNDPDLERIAGDEFSERLDHVPGRIDAIGTCSSQD